jgi:cyclohexanone monooxygenase
MGRRFHATGGRMAHFEKPAEGSWTQHHAGFVQGCVAANTTAMFERRGEHIAYIISEALARGATTVEPSQEAQNEWIRTIRKTAVDNSQLEMECMPGYYNNEGGRGGEGIRSHLGEPYGPGFYAFGDLLKEWRDKSDLMALSREVMGAFNDSHDIGNQGYYAAYCHRNLRR